MGTGNEFTDAAINKPEGLRFTGHSLGGGLASIIGGAMGRETVTFNEALAEDDLRDWLTSTGWNDNGDYGIPGSALYRDIIAGLLFDTNIFPTASDITYASFVLVFTAALQERLIWQKYSFYACNDNLDGVGFEKEMILRRVA